MNFDADVLDSFLLEHIAHPFLFSESEFESTVVCAGSGGVEFNLKNRFFFLGNAQVRTVLDGART